MSNPEKGLTTSDFEASQRLRDFNDIRIRQELPLFNGNNKKRGLDRIQQEIKKTGTKKLGGKR